MSLVDALILFLLIGALVRGAELGFVHQLFSTAGFFIGLFLGASLVPHTVGLANTPLARFGVTLATTLGVALVCMAIGEVVGTMIKHRLQIKEFLNRADSALGSAVAAVTLFLTIWLTAAVLVTLPLLNVQSEIRGSWIISKLNHALPPTPGVIAELGRLVTPNGFPNVFSGIEPTPTTAALPTPKALSRAVSNDRASVVKIQGIGCGGIVSGSGFVVGTNMVATNAHVVAGISAPFIIDGNGRHAATAVWFDPDLDFAVLRTTGLAGKPLRFDTKAISHGTQGGVLGYPGGGSFTADTAAILDEFNARGQNIYNQGNVSRGVYSIQATVVPGNSGGPLVALDGSVMGVVFATSTDYNNVGYALSNRQVMQEIGQAKATNHPVSTGKCAE